MWDCVLEASTLSNRMWRRGYLCVFERERVFLLWIYAHGVSTIYKVLSFLFDAYALFDSPLVE